MRAVLGVPFELGDEAQAGFNVYAERPGAFDDDTVRTVQREVLLAEWERRHPRTGVAWEVGELD